MRKILIGILHLIHKTEYQMNLENKKDDLVHAEVMRILETGMQQQMLQELIQERMNQEHLDIQGKKSDEENKYMDKKDLGLYSEVPCVTVEKGPI